jgi:MOSC domain-containing protein YiiM
MRHATLDELETGLEAVRTAPADAGTLELIVARPAPGARDLPSEGTFDLRHGLVGDRWRPKRGSTIGDSGHQVTVMSARMAALVAGGSDHARWAQAGDQLYVDFDISEANLPVGSRFAVGEVVLEVSPSRHTGCGKFIRRFGVDSMKLISSDVGRELRLRGVIARVVVPGTVGRGDAVRRLEP